MTTNKSLLLLLITVLVFTFAEAQVFTELNEVAAPLSGTGSSNLPTVLDIWAILANPAGLSRLESIEFAAAFYKPYGLSFYNQAFAGLAVPISPRFGTLAFSYSSGTTQAGGATLASETVFRLTHAFYLQWDIRSTLSLGYALNFYFLDYGESAGTSGDGSDGINLGSDTGFGLDIGLQASLHERTWIGLYARNINSPELGSAASSSKLPRALLIGVGYEPYYGLTTTFAVQQSLVQAEIQYRGGIEYQVTPWLILRAGVNTAPSRVGLGFGLRKWGIKIDYAFINHPVLPETHQFSLGYQLPK